MTARTSSFSFKGKEIAIPEIARTLHVAHVLEGSVRKAGNSVRITAQLIKAGTDTHLWSQTYDRKLDDIFAIQDEIAADVVKQLKVTLLGAAPKARTTDPEAYALYLQAVQLGRQNTAEAFQQSDALYRKVLAIDPRYAPAWDGLARNFVNEASQGLLSNKEGYAQAREAADEGARDRSGVRTGPRPARLDRDVRRQRPRRRRAALQARAGARSGGSGRAAQQRHAARSLSAAWTRRWRSTRPSSAAIR